MRIKSRVWLELNDKVLLGNGRVTLLKKIIETGSLSKAAQEMNISYRKAWNLIDSINKASEQPIVISSKGGNKGGGTSVTDYGISMIKKFDLLKEHYHNFLKEQEILFDTNDV